MGVLDKVKAAVRGNGVEAPPAHPADACRNLHDAKTALVQAQQQVHHLPKGRQDLAEAAQTEIAAWQAAVHRLSWEAMTPLERETADAMLAARRELEEAEQAVAGMRAEQGLAEEMQAQAGKVDEPKLVAAAARVSFAEARVRVAKKALERAYRAHANAQAAPFFERQDRLVAQALEALDEFEKRALPVAQAIELFEGARVSLVGTNSRRFGWLSAWYGPFTAERISRFVHESRKLLTGGETPAA